MKNNWTLKVFFLTFILAIFFSLIANFFGNFNNVVLIIAIFLVIFIGIIFDIIGTAILSANKKEFHSKASQKMKGAKKAIKLINNASSVASFCNDVVGDICGILSGSLIAILVINLFQNGNITIWNVILASICSSLTVGGKAIGKKIAIKNSNAIIDKVAIFLSLFTKE